MGKHKKGNPGEIPGKVHASPESIVLSGEACVFFMIFLQPQYYRPDQLQSKAVKDWVSIAYSASRPFRQKMKIRTNFVSKSQ